ncbi:5,10-methylenetetrahydrofolate reductase [Paenibacillus albicereus]|uniref:5,10-methylenetetrahydrofolate reductase n=1 Tax=Paenibacillus albicereus TaxID=2726185 RepID=A0A6H2H2P9_9BACL|nr:methylenetetrahydrofolate reductase [Paenibacillus albicereus]QJC53973.1 5,10-methylenetetrahydrofolate reductase [Paenibacillus albicereus]
MSSTLREKLLRKESGILTYGMTPPKSSHPPEKIREIADKQIERLKGSGIDGLVLYDVQDEAERTDESRPFPFLQALDPTEYYEGYLKQELGVPAIIYHCVACEGPDKLASWILRDRDEQRYSVFVGASSSRQQVQIRLPEAYRMCGILNERLLPGGVVIPERHRSKGDEHERARAKQEAGCGFFVSQATFDVEASKSFLSDYYYSSRESGTEMAPILFNLAPCGSAKTLEFMKWLGISIPKWLENELIHSVDILDKSVQLSRQVFRELYRFGLEKGIPIGCSVESVSTRKVEIEASIQLLRDIREDMAQIGAELAPAVVPAP